MADEVTRAAAAPVPCADGAGGRLRTDMTYHRAPQRVPRCHRGDGRCGTAFSAGADHRRGVLGGGGARRLTPQQARPVLHLLIFLRRCLPRVIASDNGIRLAGMADARGGGR
ncbi:hypothetical protein KCP69_18375 [Salmonella enterica subsp. enterica]|nr:hypothetical protein KCP69_18375 [Salmonella enterica subsp. enterica]